MTILTIKNTGEIQAGAETFLKAVNGKRKFAFYGKMGAGKTTFIKALCRQLGATDTVNSPTFALINEYQTSLGEMIYHIDLYRINTLEELYDIGYEEYFYGTSYLFIEWPELAEEILPEDITRVTIDVTGGNTRHIIIP